MRFSVVIKPTLSTGRRLGWNTRGWPLLALSAPWTSRTGRAPLCGRGVWTRRIRRLSDAVPWVGGRQCGWDCSSVTSLFIYLIVLILEWVAGLRGRAGSRGLRLERRQRACVWRCCSSRRGWGRGFLPLSFWLDQGKPRWVFRFMGTTEPWDTDSDGGGHTRKKTILTYTVP